MTISGKSDLVDLQASHILRESKSKLAVLIDFDLSGHDIDPVWLPLSQIEIDYESGIITMPKWLAKEKGLIEK